MAIDCMAASVATLLSKLNLNQYADVFEDEAITEISLLTSMGSEMLRENLEELGLDIEAIDKLAAELFPAERTTDQTLNGHAEGNGQLNEFLVEDNRDGVVEEESIPVPSGGEKLPDDLTQEEIDAAEAEAQWLLNPLSMLDLSYTKTMLMNKMKEGIEFQKRGQHGTILL